MSNRYDIVGMTRLQVRIANRKNKVVALCSATTLPRYIPEWRVVENFQCEKESQLYTHLEKRKKRKGIFYIMHST